MSTHIPLAITVSQVIDARPDTLYDLVADITNMGRLSPETTAAAWIGSATAAAPGVRFKGSNAIGKITWSTKPTITAADPGRRFAFQVPGRSGAPLGVPLRSGRRWNAGHRVDVAGAAVAGADSLPAAPRRRHRPLPPTCARA